MPRSPLKFAPLLIAVMVLGACASGPSKRGQSADGAIDKRFAPAFALMQDEAYGDAEKALLKLSKSHANDARLHLNLGIVYARTQRFDEAIAALERARALAPKVPAVHNELGIVLRQQGEFAGSAAAYRAAIKLDPAYANAHYNLGVLLDLYLRQHSEALVHYEAYLSLTAQDDKKVQGWVKDLQRRTASGPSTANAAQQVERR